MTRSPSSATATAPVPILAVDDLTRRFGGLTAVNECSFRIEAGRITGIIGPNGAGKTTIFNMVAGALPPSSGRILFDGADVSGLPTHELFHRGIVRTFQIPHEFGRLTVLENLMVVPAVQPGERLWRVWTSPARVRRREREVRERAEEALRFLTLWEVRDELAANLSGGQKKLLELGRAMMTEPRLVLLDEPGAGVNPTLLLELRDMIRHLNRRLGYTFVIIEHDMDLIASLCERVIVLAEGSVLTEGTMDAVRRDPRVIDAYLGGGEEDGPAPTTESRRNGAEPERRTGGTPTAGKGDEARSAASLDSGSEPGHGRPGARAPCPPGAPDEG